MTRQRKTGVAALLIALGFASASGSVPAAETPLNCSVVAIQAVAPSDTTIVSTTPQSDPVAYCDVLGYVTTTNPGPNQVNFELGLPAAWNGRFLFIGNGGFGGSFDFPSVFLGNFTLYPLQTEVSAGFAAIITDTGHQGDSFLDGSWAINDRSKQDDWLFRGVHVTAVAGEVVTKGFYGTIGRSHFAGCSDGGREGLVEAQQYADDFDGITVGDPAIGDAVVGFNWNEERITSEVDSYLPPDKIELVNKAALNSCDATDGVQDDLIQDPRRCTLDPASLSLRRADRTA